GKKVEFEIEQDPSLLGGLQVYIGTYVIDGSVTGRLNRFHKHLLDEVGQLKSGA
ncbi:MAG: F0F1 ATP synthase subunit delta, partial [Deltaproteobacteria bacterium]|nr:F0F1 ATP synthase subunit delta [Deltaproteobacteria bacterium]